jgi:GntR family transcriptional regulator, transcriptional repressor for pyruvate dehydrogenase complex
MNGPPGEVMRIVETLLERIVSGIYSPGVRLPPEVNLAVEFNCSRSTLREALRHLGALGLVMSRRGSGVVVLDFRKEGNLSLLPTYLACGKFDHPLPVFIEELMNMRRLLASEAARLAASYGTPERLKPAHEVKERLVGILDPRMWVHTELELYRELVNSSAMWPAVWMGNAFWAPLLEVHERFHNISPIIPADYNTWITKLFALIEDRKAKEAAEFVRHYFETLDGDLITALNTFLKSLAHRWRKPSCWNNCPFFSVSDLDCYSSPLFRGDGLVGILVPVRHPPSYRQKSKQFS